MEDKKINSQKHFASKEARINHVRSNNSKFEIKSIQHFSVFDLNIFPDIDFKSQFQCLRGNQLSKKKRSNQKFQIRLEISLKFPILS